MMCIRGADGKVGPAFEVDPQARRKFLVRGPLTFATIVGLEKNKARSSANEPGVSLKNDAQKPELLTNDRRTP